MLANLVALLSLALAADALPSVKPRQSDGLLVTENGLGCLGSRIDGFKEACQQAINTNPNLASGTGTVDIPPEGFFLQSEDLLCAYSVHVSDSQTVTVDAKTFAIALFDASITDFTCVENIKAGDFTGVISSQSEID